MVETITVTARRHDLVDRRLNIRLIDLSGMIWILRYAPSCEEAAGSGNSGSPRSGNSGSDPERRTP